MSHARTFQRLPVDSRLWVMRQEILRTIQSAKTFEAQCNLSTILVVVLRVLAASPPTANDNGRTP